MIEMPISQISELEKLLSASPMAPAGLSLVTPVIATSAMAMMEMAPIGSALPMMAAMVATNRASRCQAFSVTPCGTGTTNQISSPRATDIAMGRRLKPICTRFPERVSGLRRTMRRWVCPFVQSPIPIVARATTASFDAHQAPWAHQQGEPAVWPLGYSAARRRRCRCWRHRRTAALVTRPLCRRHFAAHPVAGVPHRTGQQADAAGAALPLPVVATGVGGPAAARRRLPRAAPPRTCAHSARTRRAALGPGIADRVPGRCAPIHRAGRTPDGRHPKIAI